MFFLDRTIHRMCYHVAQMPGLSGCNDRCLYYAPNGNRCLIGFLIPDEYYHPSWDEGDGTGWLRIENGPLVSALEVGMKREGLMPVDESLTSDDIDILLALQRCHDEIVRDANGKVVDPSADLDKWRLAVIQRLRGIRYVARLLPGDTSPR